MSSKTLQTIQRLSILVTAFWLLLACGFLGADNATATAAQAQSHLHAGYVCAAVAAVTFVVFLYASFAKPRDAGSSIKPYPR